MKAKANIERLHILWSHLMYGDLGHKEFNIGDVHVPFEEGKGEPNFCGTAGCAMGELPVIWPNYWKFNNYGIRVKGKVGQHYTDDVEKWFGLSWRECKSLFYAHNQDRVSHNVGLRTLTKDATKAEVAHNIRRFIDYKISVEEAE